MPKARLATVSLAGCFGCHMSLLDLDEALFELADLVEMDRSPLTDIRAMGHCDIGFIEGGCANEENVHTARLFREKCRFVCAVGACAVTGGIPALRNNIPLAALLATSYLEDVANPVIPNDPELPMLLDKVYPIHEVIPVDYTLPGCPPSAQAIALFVKQLLAGQPINLPYKELHYD
jgi:NAD-reducing hydrogenase small subunit